MVKRPPAALSLRLLAGLLAGLLLACGEPSARPPVRRFDWVPFTARDEARAYVVFDQSKEALSSPFDLRFVGLSRWADLLEGQGAAVSLNHQPLDQFLPAFCGPRRVLVLGVPWQTAYSSAEVDALERCLQRGGGALLIAEHDDIYGHAALQNAIARRFGVEIRADAALGVPDPVDPFATEWPQARSDALGLEDVRVYLSAPLDLAPPASPLLELVAPLDPGSSTVAALSRSGHGALVVLGDLELFWNMTPESGIRAGGNASFARALIELASSADPVEPADARASPRAEPAGSTQAAPLPPAAHASGPDAAPAPAARVPPEWRSGPGRVLFESAGGALVPDGRPNGLTTLAATLADWGFSIEIVGAGEIDYASADLLVVALPRRPLPVPEQMARAARLLLIGDGQQDLLEAEPGLEGMLPLDFSHEPREHPLDALARPFGVEFLGVTLLSERESYFATGRWEDGRAEFPLIRSGALHLSPRSSAISVLARAVPGTRATQLLSPVHAADAGESLRLDSVPPRPAYPGRPILRPDSSTGAEGVALSEDLERFWVGQGAWPVIVSTERVFAVADLELVTDAELRSEGGSILLERLRDWLGVRGRPGAAREAGSTTH